MSADDATPADPTADVERLRKELAEAEAALAQKKAADEEPAAEQPEDEPVAEDAAPAKEPAAETSGAAADGPLSTKQVDAVRAGYAFEGTALELGALVNGEPLVDVPVRIPLAMLNRHGLVAGATGTGKTRTLQGLAEQLSANGVPVFAADIKGDLSGMSVPGEGNDKLLARTKAIGQDWSAQSFPVEYLALGGEGHGVPVRATLTGFGPLLLAKVLGLNHTQESSLTLVFHYADDKKLPLVELEDLRTLLTYLTSDEGKAELKGIGGLSSATAGVILRELVAFAEGGAEVFFGEPEFDVKDFLRTAPDGRGIISLLEVPGVADRPELFSTFLMYLLAELYELLPEEGDLDKPKLVFFFDEAHLLFSGASKDFIAAITQTVRLIRSKGVGVFFVTQSPKDVHKDVLGQLGSRVQHQLRAFTPDDAKALRDAARTYPTSGYDLEQVLQNLGTGEAIVTVMGEEGAPTPVAWSRVRAPQGLMDAAEASAITAAVEASPLKERYAERIDRESAHEILTAKTTAAAQNAEASAGGTAADEYERQKADIEAQAQKEYDRLLKKGSSAKSSRKSTSNPAADVVGRVVSNAANQLVRSVVRGLFGMGRRR